jgi:hypothetical protein
VPAALRGPETNIELRRRLSEPAATSKFPVNVVVGCGVM